MGASGSIVPILTVLLSESTKDKNKDALKPLHDPLRLATYTPISPADVIVFREGEYAVVVDGKTKEVIARSTDSAEVVQKAIDHVYDEGGGVVVVMFDTSNITVTLKSNVLIVSLTDNYKYTFTDQTFTQLLKRLKSDKEGRVFVEGIEFSSENSGDKVGIFTRLCGKGVLFGLNPLIDISDETDNANGIEIDINNFSSVSWKGTGLLLSGIGNNDVFTAIRITRGDTTKWGVGIAFEKDKVRDALLRLWDIVSGEIFWQIKHDGSYQFGNNVVLENVGNKARIYNTESIQIPFYTNCADLPSSGNFAGDMRVCYDTGAGKYVIKVWDGSAWQTIG